MKSKLVDALEAAQRPVHWPSLTAHISLAQHGGSAPASYATGLSIGSLLGVAAQWFPFGA
jgi:hypothetical protein